MKKFFDRDEEEIEDCIEDEEDLDIINLDETAGWSKLDVAEEMIKQKAANLMEEIGDELAILDVVEEDVKIEELKPREAQGTDTYKSASKPAPVRKIQELTEIDLEEEELSEDELEIVQLRDDDFEIERLSGDEESDEYMTEEEDDEEEDSSFTFFDGIADWFAGWTIMDKVVALTGILVLTVAIVTVSAYAGKRGADKQLEAFAPVGEQLETIGIVGQDKLFAVADAKKAMLEAAKLESELNQEYEENELSTEVKVVMKMTSVQKDLKIKFVNKKTGKLVGNVPFEVKITDSENKTYSKIDEDKDGIIYMTNLVPGNYSIAMVELKDVEGYAFATSTEKIKVKETIAYEKIDVTEEIKDQSEVDVSKEDTAQKTETESTLKDTVEWVESTKKESSSGEGYVPVDKNTIAEPTLSASLNFNPDFGVLRAMQQSVLAVNDITPLDDVAVTGIAISPSTLSLQMGSNETATLTATVEPGDATNKTVTWNTDNSSVVTVENGNVKAVAAGTATITVTTEDGGKTAECSVTVEPKEEETPPEDTTVKVTGVSLDKENLSLKEGGSQTLTATVAPDDAKDKSVSWSSNNTEAATVDNSGKVTAIKEGTARITVTTTDGGKTAACTVTVTKKEEEKVAVTGVTLNKTTLELEEGKTESLIATVAPIDATDKTVTFSSDKKEIATVDGSGKVTAVKAGTATITVTTTDGGKTAACTVTVKKVAASAAVTGVKLNKNTLELTIGAEETLTATVEPGDAKEKSVSWSSSNTDVATVDNGKVKAKAAGETVIKVTTKDGNKTAECKVKVKEAAFTLDKTTATLKIGETLNLKAAGIPSGKTVTWKSSDENKATVDSNGKVTAKAEGEVTITATAGDKTATCRLTVSQNYDPKKDTTKALKDKSGNQMYILKDGKYIEAKVADYYKYDTFYKKEKVAEYIYTGWQNLDGKTYYFDKNGNKVTGAQVIQGAQYNFNSDGTLNTGSGILGIDVSTWNGNIDWNKVKNAGVSYVIIRTGFRGSTQGALVEDNRFKQNIKGATNAGLKVGVYFFSQAVNEVEAVEEASMVLSQVKGYKLTYPVFIDVEPSGGRADRLSSGERTKVINAFCQTIQNGGLRAGVYANKTWLSQKMNVSALSGYKIWLAQYNSKVTYSGRYDMWQYSDKGTIPGIPEKVDLNLSYLTY